MNNTQLKQYRIVSDGTFYKIQELVKVGLLFKKWEWRHCTHRCNDGIPLSLDRAEEMLHRIIETERREARGFQPVVLYRPREVSER